AGKPPQPRKVSRPTCSNTRSTRDRPSGRAGRSPRSCSRAITARWRPTAGPRPSASRRRVGPTSGQSIAAADRGSVAEIEGEIFRVFRVDGVELDGLEPPLLAVDHVAALIFSIEVGVFRLAGAEEPAILVLRSAPHAAAMAGGVDVVV